MDPWVSSAIAAGIGAFVGSLLAFTFAVVERQLEVGRREGAALNTLILDLAGKRVFVAPDAWRWYRGERKHVRTSILEARALVREARKQLRPNSPALQDLRQMTVALNRCLSASTDGSDAVKTALSQLSSEMSGAVDQLHRKQPKRIYADLPGSLT